MRAIVMTGIGGPEVLQPRTGADPHPGPGEILVRTSAVPVLFPETLIRAGAVPGLIETPAVFGFQAAGVVIDIGPGTDPTLRGHTVMVAAGSGSYAEKICVPAESALVVPAGVEADAAAAATMGGSVALALLRRAAVAPGETVLIQAASAGVGGYLVQSAAAAGVTRIIATAGGPVKTGRARTLGAHEVLDHTDPDWPDQLDDLLDGSSVDIVFDAFGGHTTTRLLTALTPVTGRMLGYGFLSGAPAAVTAADLLPHGLSFTACTGPEWLTGVARERAEVLRRVAAGALEPLVDRVLPLEQAAEAHRLVERRETYGTILLRPDSTAAQQVP